MSLAASGGLSGGLSGGVGVGGYNGGGMGTAVQFKPPVTNDSSSSNNLTSNPIKMNRSENTTNKDVSDDDSDSDDDNEAKSRLFGPLLSYDIESNRVTISTGSGTNLVKFLTPASNSKKNAANDSRNEVDFRVKPVRIKRNDARAYKALKKFKKYGLNVESVVQRSVLSDVGEYSKADKQGRESCVEFPVDLWKLGLDGFKEAERIVSSTSSNKSDTSKARKQQNTASTSSHFTNSPDTPLIFTLNLSDDKATMPDITLTYPQILSIYLQLSLTRTLSDFHAAHPSFKKYSPTLNFPLSPVIPEGFRLALKNAVEGTTYLMPGGKSGSNFLAPSRDVCCVVGCVVARGVGDGGGGDDVSKKGVKKGEKSDAIARPEVISIFDAETERLSNLMKINNKANGVPVSNTPLPRASVTDTMPLVLYVHFPTPTAAVSSYIEVSLVRMEVMVIPKRTVSEPSSLFGRHTVVARDVRLFDSAECSSSKGGGGGEGKEEWETKIDTELEIIKTVHTMILSAMKKVNEIMPSRGVCAVFTNQTSILDVHDLGFSSGNKECRVHEHELKGRSLNELCFPLSFQKMICGSDGSSNSNSNVPSCNNVLPYITTCNPDTASLGACYLLSTNSTTGPRITIPSLPHLTIKNVTTRPLALAITVNRTNTTLRERFGGDFSKRKETFYIKVFEEGRSLPCKFSGEVEASEVACGYFLGGTRETHGLIESDGASASANASNDGNAGEEKSKKSSKTKSPPQSPSETETETIYGFGAHPSTLVEEFEASTPQSAMLRHEASRHCLASIVEEQVIDGKKRWVELPGFDSGWSVSGIGGFEVLVFGGRIKKANVNVNNVESKSKSKKVKNNSKNGGDDESDEEEDEDTSTRYSVESTTVTINMDSAGSTSLHCSKTSEKISSSFLPSTSYKWLYKLLYIPLILFLAKVTHRSYIVTYGFNSNAKKLISFYTAIHKPMVSENDARYVTYQYLDKEEELWGKLERKYGVSKILEVGMWPEGGLNGSKSDGWAGFVDGWVWVPDEGEEGASDSDDGEIKIEVEGEIEGEVEIEGGGSTSSENSEESEGVKEEKVKKGKWVLPGGEDGGDGGDDEL